MPIYAYRCASCGHARDVLQKLSDAPLTACPSCGADTFSKQVTAAGFQLKGSGWYTTDFRGGNSSSSPAPSENSSSSGEGTSDKGDGGSGSPESSASGTSSGGCGDACACH